MPSRAAHLIAFLTIVSLSVGLHVYIFRQFARMIRRDFPKQQKAVLRIAKGLFVYFELPFLYMFFWKHISADVTVLTQLLMYPFAVWQMVMLVWGAILVPIGILRSKAVRVFSRSTKKLILKPIAFAARRSLRPLLGRRHDVILEPSEEMV
jgi:hypothetical protein